MGSVQVVAPEEAEKLLFGRVSTQHFTWKIEIRAGFTGSLGEVAAQSDIAGSLVEEYLGRVSGLG